MWRGFKPLGRRWYRGLLQTAPKLAVILVIGGYSTVVHSRSPVIPGQSYTIKGVQPSEVHSARERYQELYVKKKTDLTSSFPTMGLTRFR